MTDQVLVIEDDADIAASIRTVLNRCGYDVTGAADGREGLRVFHAGHPDLVVMDIGLPTLDGWQVLERIRDMSDVPIILLTAHGQESDTVPGLNGGADDYLTKPFGNSELVPGFGVLRAGAERRRGGADRVRERAARAGRAGHGHAAGGAGLAGLGGQGQRPAGGAAGESRVRRGDARGAGRGESAGRGRDPGERAGQERPAAGCAGGPRRRGPRRRGPGRDGEDGAGRPARADRPDPGRPG